MTVPFALTRPELAVFQVVYELVIEQGIQPTCEQVAQELGMASKGHVSMRLTRIAKKGWIERMSHMHYIRILHPPPMPDFELEFVSQFEDERLLAEIPDIEEAACPAAP